MVFELNKLSQNKIDLISKESFKKKDKSNGFFTRMNQCLLETKVLLHFYQLLMSKPKVRYIPLTTPTL